MRPPMQHIRVPPHVEASPDAEVCPCCGLRYRDFRTGETFESVRQSMFVASDDPKDWRHKRRNGVLGRWREIKRAMWVEHQVLCQGVPF